MESTASEESKINTSQSQNSGSEQSSMSSRTADSNPSIV